MTAALARGFVAAALVALAASASAADATREVHGASDAIALPGVALAWAVLRAPKGEDATVVLRVEPDPAAFAWVGIVGRDPFAGSEATILEPSAVGGPFDVRIPRARFADTPRTEIRLWRAGTAPASAPPALAIYFLGVPDTTPELAHAGALASSLAARLDRARAGLAGKPR